ncbi:L-type lectin-domain containing receptor kinase SIT2 [Aegilops tauschii subsp. strangulata]|uniref:non-specific serine/threonine protein kinase n=2 Tax=Aegilops tauschii subsp. strangulata TaxID=200361 RepID=A0A453E4S9_AEGTS|nr:L-type lectin-domain containing receptor kinase SIT2 [Aegilops tauschii subsp. strangulata]
MMNSVLMLVRLLILCLVLAAKATGDDQLVYSGFTGANLTLDGAATVTPDGLLELTNGTDQQKGHAFYPTPLRFAGGSPGGGTVRSFSASFVFAIQSIYTDLSAHGMAFVVASSKNFSSALPGQLLGLTDIQNNGNGSNHFFAVELDTIQNKEFDDLNANHAGANVNGLRSLQSYYAGYFDDEDGSFHNLSLISREAMQVWVDYDHRTAQITVTMAPLKVGRPVRPLFTTTYNLTTAVTDVAYVGFSSATGTINVRHYVLGWSFAMNGPAPAIDIAKLPKLPRMGPKPRSKVLDIVLPIASGAFVLALGAIVLLVLRRRFRYAELREDWEVEFGPQRFSYKDLYRATEGFSDTHLLGIGGFGRVYRGTLLVSKVEVAVKKVAHDSKQGIKEFISEVVSIGRLQHSNLAPLLGYCRRRGELFLVYEYMPNGSVDKYLHRREGKPILNWAQRWHIIKGIASCLVYLHEEWEKVVIHRDIKASNVLLDGDMNGRLGDFGLARLYDHDADPQTTHVVGTIGYLAPELGHTSKATPLTDVFAFGVFILEVTCGQRPVNPNLEDSQVLLVESVLEQWNKGSLLDAVDKQLGGNYNADEACLALKLGLLCSHPFANARPTMRQVMQYLDRDMPLPEMTPTDLSFQMMTIMQNEGFDQFVMTYPSSTASVDSTSVLTVGR